MFIPFRGKNRFIKDPNICPHCHFTITPNISYQILTKDTDGIDSVISAWQCSNLECDKIFLCIHKWDEIDFIFERFFNGLTKGPEWPKPIKDLTSGKDAEKIKSKFIKTYIQSLEAENFGLDELAGMGYRKAIEYLVKDWAIQNNPDKEEKIKSSWLGNIIKDYFEGDLKDILERATWLGNDQAHYNRLFEEFDVDVLKELIDLIMVELDRQYKKAHYIKIITNKNNTQQ